MRDPKRIEQMLSLLKQIWQENPDLRFGQLLYILQSDYSHDGNKHLVVEEKSSDGAVRTGYDFFNLEDDLFIRHLEKYIDENG